MASTRRTGLWKALVVAAVFLLFGAPSTPVSKVVPTVGGDAMAGGFLCRWRGLFCGPGDVDPYMEPMDLPCDDPWEWMDPVCGGPTAPPQSPDCPMMKRKSVPTPQNPMIKTSVFQEIDRARAWGSAYRSECPYGGTPERGSPVTMNELLLANHARTMLGMGRMP